MACLDRCTWLLAETRLFPHDYLGIGARLWSRSHGRATAYLRQPHLSDEVNNTPGHGSLLVIGRSGCGQTVREEILLVSTERSYDTSFRQHLVNP